MDAKRIRRFFYTQMGLWAVAALVLVWDSWTLFGWCVGMEMAVIGLYFFVRSKGMLKKTPSEEDVNDG